MWSVLFPDSSSNCIPLYGQLNPVCPWFTSFSVFCKLKSENVEASGPLYSATEQRMQAGHRLSHHRSSTKHTVERVRSLDGEGFGREGVSILGGGGRIQTLRKSPSCYSLSFVKVFVFFFFNCPLLINSILSILSKELQVPTIHMYSIVLLCTWYTSL